MHVLAISGSLRTQSTNTAILRAAILLAPAELQVVFFEQLEQIPHFNPDKEAELQSAALDRFRAMIRESRAVIISTPEYAHGIPGTLKNAMDWLVGGGELYEKPVALWHASSHGVHARAALKDVLAALNARLLHDAEVTVELPRRTMSFEEIAGDPVIALTLRSSLQSILAARE